MTPPLSDTERETFEGERRKLLTTLWDAEREINKLLVQTGELKQRIYRLDAILGDT